MTYSVRLGDASNELVTIAENLTEPRFSVLRAHSSSTFWQMVAISGEEVSEGPILMFTVVGDTRAPTLRGDAVDIGPTTARIIGTADESVTGEVRFGRQPDLSDGTTVTSDAGLGRNVSVDLTELTDGVYYYEVIGIDGSGNVGRSAIRSFSPLRAADTTPPVFLAGPTVEGIEDVTAVVRFRLNERSAVEVALSGNGVLETISSDPALIHIIRLDGDPSTEYEIVVTVTDAAGNEAQSPVITFQTRESPDIEPPVYVQRPQTDRSHIGAIATWEVNEPVFGELRFGPASGDLTESVSTLAPGFVVSLEITDLEPNTTYAFQAVSTDLSGNVLTGAIRTFTTFAAPDTTPPIVIQGPSVRGLLQDQAIVAWKTNETAFSRIVFDTEDISLRSFRTPLSTEAKTEHVRRLTGLDAATRYNFQVVSIDPAGNISTVDGGAFNTSAEPDTTPPRLIVAATVTEIRSDGFTVFWETDEPATTELLRERVVTGNDPTPGDPIRRIVEDLVQSHNISLFGLIPDSDYRLTIRSLDATGNEFIAVLPVVHTALESDVDPPVITVHPFVLGLSEATAQIAWRTDEPATGFVEFDVLADFSTSRTVGSTRPVSNHVITLTGLEPQTRHFYRTLSADISDNGPNVFPAIESDPLEFTTLATPDVTPPEIAEGPFVLSKDDASVTLKLVTSELARTLFVFGTDPEDLSRSLSAPEFTIEHIETLTGLDPATEYHYQVHAFDVADNGPAISVIRTVATDDVPDTRPPVIISGPSSDVTATTASIVWATDEVTNSLVLLEGRQVAGDPKTEGHRVLVTNLAPETRHSYIVISADPAGNESRSIEKFFRTQAEPDIEPPIVLEGPSIPYLSDRQVTFCLLTNEPSSTELVVGTEEDFVTRPLPSVVRRDLKRFRCITMGGFGSGMPHLFRIVATDGAGNQTVIGDPRGFTRKAGVVTKFLQVPGGTGSFVTTTEEDTQRPAILRGPHAVASTTTTLTIEWETDESSDSGIDFGIDDMGFRVEAGEDVLVHRMVITNLLPGTTYQYQVGSTDPAGNASTKGIFLARTAAVEDQAAPRIVAPPSVIYLTERSAALAWQTDEAAETFVEFGTEDFDKQIATPDFVTDHRITLTNLAPSTTYRYRVQATVRWQTNELSDSAVRFGVGTDLGFEALGLIVGSARDVMNHEVHLTNLEPDTDYGFAVQSVDRSGNGPTTSDVFFFRTTDAADESPPSVPADLRVRAAEGEVVVAWTPVSDSDVAGYDILRAIGEDDLTEVVTLVPGPEYRDDGLDPDLTYRYAVRAVDAAANASELSAIIEATPDGSGRPSAPSPLPPSGEGPLLQVGNAESEANLTYNFEVALDEGFEEIVAQASGIPEGTGGLQTNVTGWRVDVALEAEQTYFWRAWAFDGVFDGAFSAVGEFVAGEVAIANPGDIDGDLTVGFTDFLVFASAFGSAIGEDRFVPLLDLSGDGRIDFSDFLQFAMLFGTAYTG